MKTLFLFLLLCCSTLLLAQHKKSTTVVKEDTTVYTVVDKMPEFPGGSEAMMQFISKNIKFPSIYNEAEIQGRVMIKCIVEKDGSLSTIIVARGIDHPLDMEAVRVVSIMPKWIPGELKGKKVRVQVVIPLNFKLQ